MSVVVSGVVLAAGSSRRFGSDKRLHPLDGGQPIALAALELWSRALGIDGLTNLYVVTRGSLPGEAPLADPLVDRLAAHPGIRANVIPAAEASLGMGHSLAAAMQRVPPGAVIVGLADMPYVRVATIKQIAQHLRGGPGDAIVRPCYRNKPGNPVGFGAQLHDTLALCTGDTGARAVVKAAAAAKRVIDFEVSDRGVLRDIDTPSDVEPHRI